MVNLVEDWSYIVDQTKWCRYGIYQVREVLDGIEVRVKVGNFGFRKTFKNREDEELKRIIDFCKHEGFIKTLGSLPDEYFFSPDTHRT